MQPVDELERRRIHVIIMKAKHNLHAIPNEARLGCFACMLLLSPVDAYQDETSLVCPRCLGSSLVYGSDLRLLQKLNDYFFEHIDDVFRWQSEYEANASCT